MTQPSVGNRIHWNDEQYTKPFVVLGSDSRQCLICGEVFSRPGSYQHSKTICYPPRSSAN